jgi:signal transduction histidine kinase
MRFGIREKLVALLSLVALLPLLAALVVITVGGRTLGIQSYGQTIQSMASTQALALEISLAKDIEKLYIALQYEPEIVAALGKRKTPKNLREIETLDAAWSSLSLESGPLADVLKNPLSPRLRRIQREDPLIEEILLTDRFGELVAATQRSGDYYQGDENWWKGAWHKGAGRVFVPPVNYDHSAGVWSIDVCMPIRDGQAVVGVAKAVLDVSKWAWRSPHEKTHETSAISNSVMLVQRDGRIFYHDDISRRERKVTEPLTSRVAQWYGDLAAGTQSGWRITADGVLQGYTPIRMPDRIGPNQAVMPSWSIVLYLPASEAFGAVRRLSLYVLCIGLGIIAAVFLVGLLLAERGIARRIRNLSYAARRVAQGDLSHRIRGRSAMWRLVGPDEVDELSRDFNRMVNRVQKSHYMLQTANEMKTNFIRVAGHELRTPVGYITAMAKLVWESKDPDRLVHAVQAMGAKAKRLDEIIQAIFKLLPNQRSSESLKCQELNVSKLLEEVYLDCSPFVERRNQRLIIELGDNVPSIRADRAKLCDVVENLVMNAIKFTPDGGVIKVRAGRQLDGHISITVQDQGHGIPEMELPHIFDPFYSMGDTMLHSSGTVEYQKRGMGLGLAIVRHFVEMHGGTVHVFTSSTGSTFTVTIPPQPPANRQEGEARAD